MWFDSQSGLEYLTRNHSVTSLLIFSTVSKDENVLRSKMKQFMLYQFLHKIWGKHICNSIWKLFSSQTKEILIVLENRSLIITSIRIRKPKGDQEKKTGLKIHLSKNHKFSICLPQLCTSWNQLVCHQHSSS